MESQGDTVDVQDISVQMKNYSLLVQQLAFPSVCEPDML
jgi:hypothetical protein